MPRNDRTPATLPNVKPFRQACRESGYGYTTMRDAHFRGDLAVIRIGRAWYVEVDEMAKFTERHTQRRTKG